MSKSRIYKWDNAKFFLIWCVVIGHIGNYFSDSSPVLARIQFWVYLFHMPAFIFLSGMLSRKSIEEKRWNKCFSYVILYFLMEIMQHLASVIIKGSKAAKIDLLHENGVPWFAFAMVWFFALSIILAQVIKKDLRLAVLFWVISIVIGIISGYLTRIGSFLVLQRTLVFFPFFYAGFLAAQVNFFEAADKFWIKGISYILIGASLIISFCYYNNISFWRRLMRGRFNYWQIDKGLDPSWGWSWRLIAYVVSGLLVLAILLIAPQKKFRVSYLGRRTLPVFALHYSVMRIALSKIPHFKSWIQGNNTLVKCLGLSVVLIIITALPIFDSFLRKLMNFPGKLMELKNK